MEFTSLSVFLTVVEEMNFTKAAERHFTSQQNVSNHIRRLEKYYQVNLFVRRPILRLTAEGEALADFARMVISGEAALVSRFADLSSRAVGILHMGISYQRSQIFIPGIWSRYRELHPNISLRMREQMTISLLEELLDGTLDLIVGVDIPQTNTLNIIPLSYESCICVVAQSTFQKVFPGDWAERLERYNREGVSVSDLKNLPLVLPSHDNQLRARIDQVFRKEQLYPNIVLETSSHSLLTKLSSLNGNISLVSPLSLFEMLHSNQHMLDNCYTFKVKDMAVSCIGVAYRKDIIQPQYVLDMVDVVCEEFNYYNTDLAARFG